MEDERITADYKKGYFHGIIIGLAVGLSIATSTTLFFNIYEAKLKGDQLNARINQLEAEINQFGRQNLNKSYLGDKLK